jgi:hypothetical protein
MAIHRFAINVPNPSAQGVAAELRLEPVKKGLPGVTPPLPDGQLRVENAGLSLDPCGDAGKDVLGLKLAPFSSAAVTAAVTIASGKGVAAYHVVDRRDGKIAGGVTIVCTEPALQDAPGQVIAAPHPCPVTLAGTSYEVMPDADPSKRSTQTGVQPGADCDFVAPLINATGKPIEGVVAYLEHLGGADASFVPMTWNIGAMKPKDLFFATWRIHPAGGKTGSFRATLVLRSSGSDPTRISAPLTIGQGAPGVRRKTG